MKVFRQLWQDEAGYILSAEAALLGTIGVAGVTVGLGAAAKAVNDELTEVAYSFRSLDQSYHISGTYGCCAWTAASCFTQQDVQTSHQELGYWIEQQQGELEGEETEQAPGLPDREHE